MLIIWLDMNNETNNRNQRQVFQVCLLVLARVLRCLSIVVGKWENKTNVSECIFTAERYASAVFTVILCLSICLSVCTKVAKYTSRKQSRTMAHGLDISIIILPCGFQQHYHRSNNPWSGPESWRRSSGDIVCCTWLVLRTWDTDSGYIGVADFIGCYLLWRLDRQAVRWFYH